MVVCDFANQNETSFYPEHRHRPISQSCMSLRQVTVKPANTRHSAPQPSPSAISSLPESVTQNSASTTATTPPTITINGDNPAIIQVGDWTCPGFVER